MNRLALVLIVLAGCSADAESVREPMFSGSWYDADSETLAATVDRYLSAGGSPSIGGKLLGLVAPHAGYRYSGAVAGRAYGLLKGRAYKRIVVLAPAHRYPLEGASILNVTHYRTPLGKIPLDRAVCDALLDQDHFSSIPAAHAKEHSLELQLPFLQRVTKGFALVPIVLGKADKKKLRAIGQSVLKYVDRNTLVVASSDFTHYGKAYGYVPFRTNISEELKKLDMGAVEYIRVVDADGFYRYREKTKATICGAGPIFVLLSMMPKGARGELVGYDTSGRMEGSYQRSVSYVAAGLFSGGTKEPVLMSEKFLNADEEKTLLDISKKTIDLWVRERKLPEIGSEDPGITASLREKRGVFVTLKKKGRLRGCIGYIVGVKPIYEAVMDNTVSSCSRDSRFPSVKEDELKDISISISVMSELIPVKMVEEIKVGRDGLVIRKGYRQGILLPQVPVEQGWNRDDFLTGICRKAGLPSGSWKTGAELLRFSAQVFGE